MSEVNETRRRPGHVRALAVVAASLAASLAVVPGAQATTQEPGAPAVVQAAVASRTQLPFQAVEHGRAGELAATVTVDGAPATSGAVVFTLQGEQSAPVAVVDGRAALALEAGALPVGRYAVTATYTAEGVTTSTASGTLKVFEADIDHRSAIVPGEFTAGETVEIQGRVTAEPGNVGIPTGQVQVWDNGRTPGPLSEAVDLEADGSYTLTWTVPQDAEPGARTVWVRYHGDGSFRLWNFSVKGTVVRASETTLDFQAEEYGLDGELVASVTVDGAAATSGEVVFTVDGEEQAPVAVADGRAVLPLEAGKLAAGRYPVTATYAAAGVKTSSAQNTLKIFAADIDHAAEFVPSQFEAGERVEIRGRVTAEPGNVGTPTGQVQLRVDNAQVGEVVDLAADGSFTLTWTVPVDAQPGLHRVWVRYFGDGSFAPLTFSVEGEVVEHAPGHRAQHPGKGNVPDHVKQKWAERYAERAAR